MSTTIIADHPAWRITPTGEQARLVEHQGDAWLTIWNPRAEHLGLWPITGDAAADQPPVAYTSPIELPATPDHAEPLFAELVQLGTVARLNNPSIWDALCTAILRQVVPVPQAQRRHHSLYAAYGRSVATRAGDLYLTPPPEVLLQVSSSGYSAIGCKASEPTLRAAAEAYLDRGQQWTALDPERLIKELIEVSGIDEWTAAAAAADYTGDFSIYPHGDLAVRAWATKAAHGLTFPSTDREFEALWHRWAPTRPTLHALTLFTLAWGCSPRASA
ncbi:hypothetical protein ACFTWH_00380 [Streptomyces sp. NPDC057011]|uniref:hypothetical protein n=1 Tax=unclassified Streptomyces TaxID=2593676 RepID=UPI00362DC5B5